MKVVWILIFSLFLTSTEVGAELPPHPLDFTGSEFEKQRVIQYIERTVKIKYTALGMGEASVLRLMENEELNAFKQLTEVKNRRLLDQVIQKYCNLDMCDYSVFLLMYNEELKASSSQLEW